MRVSTLSNLGVLGAAAVLAACSSGMPSATSPQSSSLLVQHLLAAARNGSMTKAFDRGESRISSDAKTHELLYASDAQTDTVYVYSFPKGKPEGTLTGFGYPSGMCTDKNGDVWIADFQAHEMLEYAHGGTSPIATLADPNGFPYDCSVDSATGNLAVANIFGLRQAPGSIAIYTGAQGSPTLYTDPSLQYIQYCGYDPHGDLFMDGTNASTPFILAELHKGAGTIKNVTMTGTVYSPGGVQWYGKYLTVGDDNYQDEEISGIDQIHISGSTGKIVSSAVFTGSGYVQQYTIAKTSQRHGKTIVVAPNLGATPELMFFKYPAGGTATKTITGFSNPIGTAVSR